MSVSTLDTSVSAASTLDLAQANAKPQANASRLAPAVLSFNGQNTANVSFHSRENQAGPVFANFQMPTDRHSHAHHHPQAAAQKSFMDQLKQWIGLFFSGHRPPMQPGCGNPPPRPNPGCGSPPPRPFPTIGKPCPTLPGRPDPQYSHKSNEQLAQQLLGNFHAFRDPKQPGYVSIDSIHAMANKGWSSNPAINENIRLAKELLRRPELLDAIDRHSTTGALDGLIDRQKLGMIIGGNNPFKYNNDKQLAQEMLDHFDALKGRHSGPDLRIKDLKKLAAKPLTGDVSKDHLIQLAQEILKRSDVLTEMDNLAGRDNDGRISRRALRHLSR